MNKGKGKDKLAGEEPRKPGRPSGYSEEVGERIAALMMAGWSLIRICSMEEYPAESTVYGWLAQKEHPFLEKYTRAREIQAERYADEIIDISDDDSRDVTGELNMPNAVAVQRAKLRTENRKWVAAKLLPKKYGDRVTQEHTGEGGGPVQFTLTRIGQE